MEAKSTRSKRRRLSDRVAEPGMKAMELERIEVRTRDEYREAQEPLGFEWRGRRFEVTRVLDRWYEGSKDSTRLPLRYFRVETLEGRHFILRYHELFRSWSLVAPRGEDSI